MILVGVMMLAFLFIKESYGERRGQREAVDVVDAHLISGFQDRCGSTMRPIRKQGIRE